MTTGINILIAEDEKNIAIALDAIINKAFNNVTVTVVNNGARALDAVFESTFQLIISDWNMPEMNGFELLTELRSKATTKDIPFLMLTARDDMPSVMSALEGGVTGYLTKPFEKQSVIDRVNQILGITSVASEDEI